MLPLYKQYENAAPVGVYAICNFGGLAILDISSDGESAVCAWSFGDGYQKIRRHRVYTTYTGRGYTRAERLELVKLAAQYEWAGNTGEENNILCRVLEIITGTEYTAATIRGCCQGDWQEIIYPAEYGRDWLETFETEYFNTGDEWRVDTGDGCEIYVYTHSWRDDEKRAEIADAIGCDPGDVALYLFTGWSRTAEYSEVSA